jgi:uncharacterized membrane protein YhaH (DUF805 family)
MHAAWALPEGEVHKDSSQFTLLKIILIMTLLFLEFASCIRRWHDINKSGWWELILFIPVVGVLAALVANGFIKGTAGENDYGSDPLEDI